MHLLRLHPARAANERRRVQAAEPLDVLGNRRRRPGVQVESQHDLVVEDLPGADEAARLMDRRAKDG